MIGIFDSGAGGLSVYREIVRLLPGEKYVYYSDNAHCPYGEKTRDYIIDRARKITDFLLGEGCDVIVVACNTATAAAIATLRAEYDVPFIGMEPAVKQAALHTRSGVVGVLATAGTLKADKYHDTRDRYADGVEVVERIGEGFVELVEAGVLDGPEAEAVVGRSLRPLLDAGADMVVLGCTHYPFLLPVIRRLAGPGVTVIDPAPAAARHLLNVMKDRGLVRRDGQPTKIGDPKAADIRLFSSGPRAALERIFSIL
ncbi:MAG: glutamate racemase [Bacteroidales bacterium]|nr:glutamate racemase [Bacteroidales bacterium]